MPFFDATDVDDLALLPKRLRTEGDLSRVAELAEEDVLEAYSIDFRQWTMSRLNQYMVWLYDDTYMCLRGYDENPTDCEENLRRALKREIARVIEWRLWKSVNNPLVTSESGTESIQGKVYRPDLSSDFPPHFGQLLKRFDVRPTPYVI